MSAPEFVSLIQLIARPENYHQKRVRVIGVVASQFEHTAIYASNDSFRHSVTKDALWLSVEVNDAIQELDGQYAVVEGTFDAAEKGHLQLCSGRIHDVVRLESWTV